MTYATREEWLNGAVQELDRLIFRREEIVLPPRLRVSIGLCGGKNRIGLCFSPECAEDMSSNLFVDPRLADPIEVLSTLAHELCHAVCYSQGYDCGHKGPFKKLVYQIGLSGKPTNTYAEEGSHMHGLLQEISVTLGDYPHSALKKPVKESKKKHNWITFVSPTIEDFLVRVNRNTVKEVGAPRDPNGSVMEPKNPEDMFDEEDLGDTEIVVTDVDS